MLHKQLRAAAAQRDVQLIKHTAVLILSGLVFPVLGINVIAMGILQGDLNRIYAKEDALSNDMAV